MRANFDTNTEKALNGGIPLQIHAHTLFASLPQQLRDLAAEKDF